MGKLYSSGPLWLTPEGLTRTLKQDSKQSSGEATKANPIHDGFIETETMKTMPGLS